MLSLGIFDNLYLHWGIRLGCLCGMSFFRKISSFSLSLSRLLKVGSNDWNWKEWVYPWCIISNAWLVLISIGFIIINLTLESKSHIRFREIFSLVRSCPYIVVPFFGSIYMYMFDWVLQILGRHTKRSQNCETEPSFLTCTSLVLDDVRQEKWNRLIKICYRNRTSFLKIF